MSSILDLSGQWELIFDTSNIGVDQRWYANKPQGTQDVNIPHTWEQDFGKYPGSVCFYFKEFTVSKLINPKRTFLRFKRSFFHTTIWLNGKLVGESMGGHHSFLVNISKAVKAGENNQLCVRVASESADRISGYPVAELPVGLPFYYKPFGGLWGDIELIHGGKACIMNMNVLTDKDDGNVHLEIQFSNPRNHTCSLMFYMSSPKGEVSRIQKDVKLEKEDSLYKIVFQLKEFEEWSPETPNLYSMDVYLDKSFGVSKKFGFRKFDILRSEYYLNDKTFKIQGAVYNLSHPQTGGFHADDSLIRKDLTHLKKCGFNSLRSGGAPLDEMALNICDELGIMVWQEMPIHNMRTPLARTEEEKADPMKDGVEVTKTIVQSIIEDHKTHPCIVAWVLGAENGTLLLENGTKLLKFAGELDDTRPVLSNLNSLYIDNEGGFKQDTGKIMGVTNDKILMFNSHRVNPRMNPSTEISKFLSSYFHQDECRVETFHDSSFGNANFREEFNGLVKSNKNGRVLMNLSVHTLIPNFKNILKMYGNAKQAENGKKLNALAKDFTKFIEGDVAKHLWGSAEEFAQAASKVAIKATQDRVDAFMSSPYVNGYFIDNWADNNTLFNGFVDEFRHSKGFEKEIQRMTKSTRILFSVVKKAVFPGQEITFQAKLLNGLKLDKAQFEIRLLNEKGDVQFEHKITSEFKGGVVVIETPHIPAPQAAGFYTLECVALKGTQELDKNTETIWVIDIEKGSLSNKFIDLEKGATPENGKVALARRVADWDIDGATQLKAWVEAGNTLVLHDLTPRDIEAMNALKWFSPLNAAFSTGAKTSSFHYWTLSPHFAGTGEHYIADSLFCDHIPNFSLTSLPEAEHIAGSVTFTEEGQLETLWDVFDAKLGKGRVVIHQYRKLWAFEENALSALLLQNLLK